VKQTVSTLLQNWRGELAALLFGALVTLSFAPFDYFPLAIICPAILFFILVDTDSHSRSFLRGYLFGLGYFATGVSWVSISMVRFGGMGLPISMALTALLVAFLALYIGAIGYIGNKFFQHVNARFKLLLVYPVLWVWLEWVRGWLFTGFPWIDIGYSQVVSPLAGLFPVMGVYGVSLAVVVCAGCLVLIFSQAVRTLKYEVLLLVGIVTVSGSMSLISWAEPVGNALKVSIIQGNIPQQIKWLSEQRQPSIDLYMRLTQQHWDSDIIIWPETALPVFYHQAREFLNDLAIEAKQYNTSMLIGLPYLETANNDTRYYNSAVVLNDGNTAFYHKYHLVPFGEYVPLKWLLGDFLGFLNIPMANFSSSEQHQPILAMSGLNASVSICYEDAFGEEVIDDVAQANFLINISNDAWFGDSLAPHQHLQKARVRALETARPMLRATNNGISAVIDHKAQILAELPQFTQAVLTVKFQPMRGTTLYARLGNYLIVTCLLLMTTGAYLLQRRNRRSVA